MQRPLPHDEHRGIPPDPDEGPGSAPEAGPPPASETDPPFIEPTYEPVPPPPPVPPNALRPWYYREWFLVPTLVWWPCSAILLLRSPWHNGVLTGILSWTWLIAGGMWIFLRIQYSGTIADPTLWALAAPGLFLTILTQSMWLTRHRPRIRRIRAGRRVRRLRHRAGTGRVYAAATSTDYRPAPSTESGRYPRPSPPPLIRSLPRP